jgi:hypothetical protein
VASGHTPPERESCSKKSCTATDHRPQSPTTSDALAAEAAALDPPETVQAWLAPLEQVQKACLRRSLCGRPSGSKIKR